VTRPAVRLALLIVFLAAMGLTATLFWMAERDVRQQRAVADAFDDTARRTLLDVAELRAAQQAYVAEGQGADFWFARTHALQADLKGRITALRAQSPASDAVAAFEAVLGSLQDFEQMDFRARERTRAQQTVAAADLIFSDGLDLTRKMADSIEQGRRATLAALALETAAVERREVFSLGAAAAAATLIVLLLVPVRAREEVVVAKPEPLEPALPLSHQLTLHEPIVPEPAPLLRVVEPVAPPPAPPEPAPAPRVDLGEVAQLCAEMARVVDTRALPGVLERAASVLDASGIVLWIADPDGRELTPIVTHGYPQQVVTRLGTIPRTAENATAAAFRTSLLQTVHTDHVSAGAIAAPIVTPAGCVGVMAAEIRNEGEQEEAILATAGIVAAQLATLVGPPSSRMKVDAAG
jgi:hypothetical protein